MAAEYQDNDSKSIDVKKVLACVYTQDNRDRLHADYERYEIYNGQIRRHVQEAITKEFLLPETVKSMIHRIVPLNILKKITNKLARIYLNDPIRIALDEMDQESLDAYSQLMGFNQVMKSANRNLELYKHALIEPFVWEGKPFARSLPSHQYTPYNDDATVRNVATVIVKHIEFKKENRQEHIHHLWSDDEFVVCTGEGAIISRQPNPYEVIPFVYINTSQDLVIPIPDDDLISLQMCICLLLSDLNFASKYQSWSMIYVIGKLGKNISFNPNSVIELTAPNDESTQPSIGTIDPKVKSDELLRLIESLIGLLLTTKSLSVGSVSTSLSANNAASGIAKVLDQAEVIDEQADQKALMLGAEQEFWGKFAGNILPVWQGTGLLDPLYYFELSPELPIDVLYPKQEVYTTEGAVVDVEIKKLDKGLSTKEMSLKKIYPDLSADQVMKLAEKIQEESDNGRESQAQNQPIGSSQNSNRQSEDPESD